MIVTVPRAVRPVDVDTFADITTKEVTSVRWAEGGLEVQFATNLSDDEKRQVRVRCATPDAATETLMRQAWTAYQSNADALALTSPTAAQTATQVAALTRQVQALIRLATPID